jgi:hypothetical protein
MDGVEKKVEEPVEVAEERGDGKSGGGERKKDSLWRKEEVFIPEGFPFLYSGNRTSSSLARLGCE